MLQKGDFIRVKKTSDFRPGQDGFVVSSPDEEGDLGLMFYLDRHGDLVSSTCVGPELWNISELDLSTIDH